MRMIWIICNESIAEDLMDQVLDRDAVEGYTVWRDVLGKDNKGDKTHWGNAVFPGKNWAFMVFGGPDTLEGVTERLKLFRKQPYVKQAGLKAFLQSADEVA